jgi:hypothetical protein
MLNLATKQVVNKHKAVEAHTFDLLVCLVGVRMPILLGEFLLSFKPNSSSPLCPPRVPGLFLASL